MKLFEDAALACGDKVWVIQPELKRNADDTAYTNSNKYVLVAGKILHIQKNEISEDLVKFAKKVKEVQTKCTSSYNVNNTLTAEEQLYYYSRMNSLFHTLINDSIDEDETESFVNYGIKIKCMRLSAYDLNQSTCKQTHRFNILQLPQNFIGKTFVKDADKADLQKICDGLNKETAVKEAMARTQSSYY
jgi:hypothetical protein